MSAFMALSLLVMVLLGICAAALLCGGLIYGVMCLGAAKWLTWREARTILTGRQ